MRILSAAMIAVLTAVVASHAASEPNTVKLSDYAFDFPTYGYEITVAGSTSNFSDHLTADDYITIRADGYSLKTLIDRMDRRDRQGFIQFFNERCIGFTADCPITASGDIELDEDMRMIFRLATATIRSSDAEWTNTTNQP